MARLRGRILVLSLIALLFLALAVQAEPSRVVQAEEILKKIEMGEPVEYERVTIVGDLDISKLELPKVFVARTDEEKDYYSLTDNAKLVISPIKITDCLILGSLNLNETVMQENFRICSISCGFLHEALNENAINGHYRRFDWADSPQLIEHVRILPAKIQNSKGPFI